MVTRLHTTMLKHETRPRQALLAFEHLSSGQQNTPTVDRHAITGSQAILTATIHEKHISALVPDPEYHSRLGGGDLPHIAEHAMVRPRPTRSRQGSYGTSSRR